MTSTQSAHDPALAHVSSAPASNQPAAGGPTAPGTQPTLSANILATMGHEQIAAILNRIPELIQRGDVEDSAAAEALSHLSQGAFVPHGQFIHGILPNQQPMQHSVLSSEPGPSSHPRGPPNLGQLSAIASALQANAQQSIPPPTESLPQESPQDGASPDLDGDHKESSPEAGEKSGKSSGRRGGRSAAMSNDEWARVRKDNHKEVERRRRGNINEGINELGRIVPNGSGEKAKGAILSRAVQYIHHLKENEARNIEKWTLEKLLMDQAMGDLQAQLEEMRRMWDEERIARQRAEAELELLRGHSAGVNGSVPSGSPPTTNAPAPTLAPAPTPAPTPAAAAASAVIDNGKREREEEEEPAEGPGQPPLEGDDRSKRARVD